MTNDKKYEWYTLDGYSCIDVWNNHIMMHYQLSSGWIVFLAVLATGFSVSVVVNSRERERKTRAQSNRTKLGICDCTSFWWKKKLILVPRFSWLPVSVDVPSKPHSPMKASSPSPTPTCFKCVQLLSNWPGSKRHFLSLTPIPGFLCQYEWLAFLQKGL